MTGAWRNHSMIRPFLSRLALIGFVIAGLAPGAALSAAVGADGKPKRARPVLAPPKRIEDAAVAAKARTRASPGYLALPPPLAPGAGFANSGFGSGGFASNALRSNLPIASDAAPVCRATCATAHYICLSTDDPSECSPRWAVCVAGCAR